MFDEVWGSRGCFNSANHRILIPCVSWFVCLASSGLVVWFPTFRWVARGTDGMPGAVCSLFKCHVSSFFLSSSFSKPIQSFSFVFSLFFALCTVWTPADVFWVLLFLVVLLLFFCRFVLFRFCFCFCLFVFKFDSFSPLSAVYFWSVYFLLRFTASFIHSTVLSFVSLYC